MKKIIISMSILIVWATSLSAENITREKADKIVIGYIQSEATQPCFLFANTNEPSVDGVAVTTSNAEKFTAKYPCWAYYLSEPSQLRYLFVKEDNGSLLEIIASNDLGPEESTPWMAMDIPTGLIAGKGSNIRLLYPNPVGDLLTVPCNGDQARVEIYDLKGAQLFSGLVSGKDACQLNVSFLNTGVYMVTVSGETYKIIKK